MQDAADMHFLELIERNLRPNLSVERLAVHRLFRQEFFPNFVRLRENRRALNRVPEFANVSPPGMGPELPNRRFRKRQSRPSELPGEELQKRSRQIFQIVQPFTQVAES